MTRISPRFLLLVFALSVLGCAATLPPEAASEADLISVGPRVAASFPGGFAIHGIGGDQRLLFAVQPSPSPSRAVGVHVARRGDGAILSDVTPPPGGWGVPLSIKIESFASHGLGTDGTFLLLDNTVPPGLAGSAPARLYRYDYSYRLATGLVTTLTETHVLPLISGPPDPAVLPDGLIYPGSIALLPDGRVAVTDNFGPIWVSTDASLDTWRMAIVDPRFAGPPRGPVSGVGRNAAGTIAPYTLLTPAPPTVPPGLGIFPGAHSIAYAAVTDEVCFAVTWPGGLYCVARSVFLDAAPPFAKSASVREVVPTTPGLGDLTDGVDYDRWAPDSPWLYWQRAPADVAGGGCNALRRVNLLTGCIETVACDNQVFSWANEISALPPLFPALHITTIASSVGQEYNNPDVNVLLGGVSTYFAPSRIPLTATFNF